ncbi:hypothetical protein HAX54_036066 [Datura stramonium]|uniref:Uncharacterized protein n=1 Tax=Datura stramonium TaxID=4076 RepID=A0ABS8SFS2_DATST|nr:hypothetical protein [Datura stramonium]
MQEEDPQSSFRSARCGKIEIDGAKGTLSVTGMLTHTQGHCEIEESWEICGSGQYWASTCSSKTRWTEKKPEEKKPEQKPKPNPWPRCMVLPSLNAPSLCLLSEIITCCSCVTREKNPPHNALCSA